MNILQVIASGGLGGREIQPVKLAYKMRQFGHKTFILVRRNSQTISFIKKYNLPYIELKMDGRLNLKSIPQLVKFLKLHQIDIIHTHISKSLLFLHIARKLSKRDIKLVFTHRMGMNVKKKDIYHRYIYTRVDQIVAISEYVKNRFINAAPYLKDKIRIVYNGVDLKKYSHKIEDKKEFLQEFNLNKNNVTIGLIGQLNYGKGHFWVLETAKVLKEKYKINNFKIFFVGKGKLEKSLKIFSRKLNLINNIIFTGFRWDVDYFYRNIDIIVVPSKAEAGGNVLIEAMGFGKPVICSDTGAFPEIVTHNYNGLMVEYENIEDFTTALYKLIKNKNLCNHLGKNAKKTIQKKFNFTNTVKYYLEIYFELLHQENHKNVLY